MVSCCGKFRLHYVCVLRKEEKRYRTKRPGNSLLMASLGYGIDGFFLRPSLPSYFTMFKW